VRGCVSNCVGGRERISRSQRKNEVRTFPLKQIADTLPVDGVEHRDRANNMTGAARPDERIGRIGNRPRALPSKTCGTAKPSRR
jgi:hypothetical protein